MRPLNAKGNARYSVSSSGRSKHSPRKLLPFFAFEGLKKTWSDPSRDSDLVQGHLAHLAFPLQNFAETSLCHKPYPYPAKQVRCHCGVRNVGEDRQPPDACQPGAAAQPLPVIAGRFSSREPDGTIKGGAGRVKQERPTAWRTPWSIFADDGNIATPVPRAGCVAF